MVVARVYDVATVHEDVARGQRRSEVVVAPCESDDEWVSEIIDYIVRANQKAVF